MEQINNNKMEVKPSPRKKRKISAPSAAAFTNPALDLLAADDTICNTTREVQPKKRKRTRSCGDPTAFDNTALDLGIGRVAVSEFLIKELENVKRNLKTIEEVHDDSSLERPTEMKDTSGNTEIESGNETQGVISQTITSNNILVSNQTNLSLSFIDRLALDSPGVSNQSLYLDDDLNESNIMEIKTITIITKKKRSDVRPKSTNPFLNCSDDVPYIDDTLMSTNPFLSPLESHTSIIEPEEMKVECEDMNVEPVEVYSDDVSMSEPPQSNYTQVQSTEIVPRRLFTADTNSTVSTVNDLSLTNIENQHEYENIDTIRAESPVYANIDEVYAANETYNKQSKILGHDVSQFNSRDILNLNGRRNLEACSIQSLDSTDRSDTKKSHDISHQINKLSKKVFRKLKRTFIGDRTEHNTTANPYEVPRKAEKPKAVAKPSGVENPALNLDYSDEIEELEDEEHLYETVKTARNTMLNMQVTPLRECNRERERTDSSLALDSTGTPGRKQVRFDSTLNREKVITGNSFDARDMMSPGLDVKIDNFHDELENCINEKKFIAQIM